MGDKIDQIKGRTGCAWVARGEETREPSLYTGCPEVSLMRAVLEDAMACVHRQDETSRRWVQREAREAEEWLFCDDAQGVFSYMSVCAVLGLEPASIRQELRRWSPSHPNPLPHSRAT